MTRKVKYNVSFELHCVKEVLENHCSVNSVSHQEGISDSLLHKWIIDYQNQGTLGLEPKKNQKYSAEFKFRVIKSIIEQHLSLGEARIKFNIPSESVIVKWQKDFANFGVDGLQPKPKGRPKIMNSPKRKSSKLKQPLTREEELLLENERLRCEVALLKKFNTLIQAQEEKLKKLGRKP